MIVFNCFMPWYNDDAFFRQKELNFCLLRNDLNKMIDRIYLFPESIKDNIPKVSEKVKVINLNRRVTYQDMVYRINHTMDSYRCYNIIMNTDIYFNETLSLVRTIDMTNICLALTRWEANPDHGEPYMYMTYESQDCWIFKGYINMNVQCGFNLGLAGCEGRFNFELEQAGYKVYNPSLDIKILHHHMSGKRNWSEDSRLQGDSINPSIISIKDMENGY